MNQSISFAIRNKVEGMKELRSDREIVNQSFEMDIEDDDSSYESFFLLSRRLGASALYVWKQCKALGFSRILEKPSMVTVLRPGQSSDYAWLKPVENSVLQVTHKELINNPPSWRKAVIGSMSRKKEIKALDTEFNGEQKEFPKMLMRADGKWLVLRAKDSGMVLASKLDALELFQSFGGKVVIK